MFVTIDMDNLVFLHKHHDHETISALSWLECGQQVSVRVEPSHDNSRFLANVSDLDVRMLYKNTTGHNLPADSDAVALRYQLGDTVQLVPITRCLTVEVLAQAALVDDRIYAGECFKYVLGSRVPAQSGELFPLKARPLTERELSTAHSHSRNPVRGYPPKLSGQAAQPWEAHEQVPTTGQAAVLPPPPPPPSEPKKAKAVTGSVRPVCRARAEATWKERGDRDWATVKADLLTTLSAEGYHPTTIRIKLNEWAKEHGVA